MNDDFFKRVEEKTSVSKDTLTDLASKLESSGLKNEETLRSVIKSLSSLTNKEVPKEKEDKIIEIIKDGKVPNNIDKMF